MLRRAKFADVPSDQGIGAIIAWQPASPEALPAREPEGFDRDVVRRMDDARPNHGGRAKMYRRHENSATILHRGEFFSHENALSVTDWALNCSDAQVVVIDLSRIVDTTTAALAAIILLRRTLMGRGRDLHLAGLSGRPLQLYQVNRLDAVLPRVDAEVEPRLVLSPSAKSEAVRIEAAAQCRAAA
jgi:ABC-type transporter Mla MlaB component